MTAHRTLRVRWLGRVAYQEADDLQRSLLEHAADDYLLLLEHPHVYTLGKRASLEHVLTPPASVGAELVHADRGGDVTYHGPGQLVGYPIVTLPPWKAGQRDVVAYVRKLEGVLIDALAELGVEAGRRRRLHRRLGRRREDRRHRCAGRAGPHPPRLRAQRRSRPHDVRPHRAVRHLRPWCDVTRALAARGTEPAARRRGDHGRVRRAFPVRRDRARGRRVARAAVGSGGVHAHRDARRRVRAAGHDRPGAPARTARGSGRRGAAGRSGVPPAAVDAGTRRPRAQLPRDQTADALPRPPHRVRVGRLPQHLRVLGRQAPRRS